MRPRQRTFTQQRAQPPREMPTAVPVARVQKEQVADAQQRPSRREAYARRASAHTPLAPEASSPL